MRRSIGRRIAHQPLHALAAAEAIWLLPPALAASGATSELTHCRPMPARAKSSKSTSSAATACCARRGCAICSGRCALWPQYNMLQSRHSAACCNATRCSIYSCARLCCGECVYARVQCVCEQCMYARMQAWTSVHAALIIACADAYHLGNGRGYAPFTRPSEVRRRRVFRRLLCRGRRCVECAYQTCAAMNAKCGTFLRRFSVCSDVRHSRSIPSGMVIHPAYRARRSAAGSGVHHNEGSGPSSTTSTMNEMREVAPAPICTGTRPAPPPNCTRTTYLRPNGHWRA